MNDKPLFIRLGLYFLSKANGVTVWSTATLLQFFFSHCQLFSVFLSSLGPCISTAIKILTFASCCSFCSLAIGFRTLSISVILLMWALVFTCFLDRQERIGLPRHFSIWMMFIYLPTYLSTIKIYFLYSTGNYTQSLGMEHDGR